MADDDPRFDPAGIGVWGEPSTFAVTEARISDYAKATNDPHPRHLAGELAPPVFAIVPVFESLVPAALSVAPVELLPKLVHGEQDFRFHRPILPGTTLVSRAKPIGFEGRPNGTRGTVYLESRDGDGQLVTEQWVTFFFRKFDAGVTVGELGPRHGFDEHLADTAPLATVTQHIDTDQTFRYSPAAGDPMPIHLDEDIAKLSGLPGIIVHGLCTMAFTSWAILGALGVDEPERLTRLAVRFAKPVLPGQDITTRIWPTGASGYAYRTSVGDTLVITDGLADIQER